jgi:hypothetical protein
LLKAGERLLQNLAKQEYKTGALKTVIVVSVILSVISGIIFAVMLIKMNVEGFDSLKYVVYLIVMDLIFSFLLYFSCTLIVISFIRTLLPQNVLTKIICFILSVIVFLCFSQSYQKIYAENTADSKGSFSFSADLKFIQKYFEFPDDTIEQAEYYMYVSNCRYSTSICFVNMDFTDIKSGNNVELVMPKNFQTLIHDLKRKSDKDFIKLNICVYQNSHVVTSYNYSVISKEEIAEYEEVFS